MNMNHRALLIIFAFTLFTSAFLIFSVQPMVGKMLLPLFGGSPSVWNTAMVFFQAMLLAGYGYAHFAARFLSLKTQAILHLGLLCVFTVVLPLALPPEAIPPEKDGQAYWQLGLMLTCVGGPFFILAASAPLFQHWFSCTSHEDAENPYFLYAVSNAGSLIALFSYPIIIEPLLTLTNQTYIWFAGYGILMGLTAMCAWLIRNSIKPAPSLFTSYDKIEIGWKYKFIWILLAFIPSSLMLGVTTIITTDITSAPFLWVIPLAIYLMTFIIAFSKKPVISLYMARELSAFALVIAIFVLMLSAFIAIKIPMVIAHLLAFFLCAQICHSELAESKPPTSNLTEYFLLISFGGVLGGVFSALIAPKLFTIPMEYSLTLAIIPFIIWAGEKRTPTISKNFNDLKERGRHTKLMTMDVTIVLFALALCIGCNLLDNKYIQITAIITIFALLFMIVQNRPVFSAVSLCALLTFQPALWSSGNRLLTIDRNYFGVLKVQTRDDTNYFYHGTTVHGAQSQKPEWKLRPIAYYSEGGPASNIFSYLDRRGGNQKIAGLGLGVGSIVCYGGANRHFDFYEIDSDVVKIAEDPRYFTYLTDCPSPHSIIIGDARRKIANAPDHSYDMIFVDTFSSDNIPVHIITKEALDLYRQKLVPGGIIAVNISNRYLDLRPVLAAISRDLGLAVYFKHHRVQKIQNDISSLYTDSIFAVIADKPETIATFVEEDNWEPYGKMVTMEPWTDDYANILSSLWIFQNQ